MPTIMLWLIGPKNIQNSLLIGYLQQNIHCDCVTLDPYTQANNLQIEPDHIICIDAAALNYKQYEKILDSLPKINKVFFINLDHDRAHERLLQWPSVCGFFYKDNRHSQVSEGLNCILKGELWFSREVLNRYMSKYRKSPSKMPQNIVTLTSREKEILSLSVDGDTNAEIAEVLGVSKHTVKTHMYNLFKKLNVSNRVQAINWAKQHLSQHHVI